MKKLVESKKETNPLSHLVMEALKALNLAEEAKKDLYKRIVDQQDRACYIAMQNLGDTAKHYRHFRSTEDLADVFVTDWGDRIVVKTDMEVHIHRVDFIAKVKIYCDDETIVSTISTIHCQTQHLPSLV